MRALFDDEGFSTIGAAIALLLSLSLVFSLGGVYRISSDAAAIQDAADAAALAAMNEVAEYMVAVRVCDAVVLTMSLTGLAMYGAGVAVLCVPTSAPVGVKLVGMADKVLDARDSFSRQANRALLEAARALPFLAAVNAASVASANGQRWGGNVAALALLVPSEVKESTFLQDAAELKEKEDEAARAIQDDAARIQDLSEEAERVSQEALAAKTRAFEHDCGRDPSYCMSERAAHLAGLRSIDNPRFSSVDAWSFTVALERAKSYYAARLASEAPLDSSVEEGARSALRRAFYEYALEELEFAYVHEDAEEFDAFFPLMPANTVEMRATALYSDAVYPVTVDALSGSNTMHAWDGCPRATSVVAYGSLETLERGGFVVCTDCGFTAASLGKVASATSSVETGFEFHYDKVARSAQEYEIARQAAEESSKAVRASVQNVFDALADALRLAARQRISIVPPGSQGVIVLAVDFSEGSSRGYRVPFVQWSGTLGPRAAVSAATLLEEESQEGRTLVSSLLDGLAPTGGALVGAGAAMTDCWSRLLEAYGEGQQALEDAVEELFDAVPLGSASGLGSWAEDAFEKGVRSLGLQPANLNALKPVLVNSGYVARKGTDAFSVRYLQVKDGAIRVSGPSTSLFSSAVHSLEDHLVEKVASTEGKVELAVVEVPELGVSVPIVLALPPAAIELTEGFLHDAASAVRSAYATLTDSKVWQ